MNILLAVSDERNIPLRYNKVLKLESKHGGSFDAAVDIEIPHEEVKCVSGIGIKTGRKVKPHDYRSDFHSNRICGWSRL